MRIIISRENWYFLLKRFAKKKITKWALWHEGEAGRNAFNVANTFISFIKEGAVGADEIIFYTELQLQK